MPKLYHMPASGNCYKIRLLAAQLGLDLDEQEVDIAAGESNAILCWMAEDTPLWAGDRLQRARVLQWLFFEQYSHEPYIATNRAWLTLFGRGEEMRERIEANKPSGYAALDVMEQALDRQDFLAGGYGIADIALFAYTHVAEEGEYDLSGYPNIRGWLQRVRQQPGFVPMSG